MSYISLQIFPTDQTIFAGYDYTHKHTQGNPHMDVNPQESFDATIFHQKAGWFFPTKEGINIGPFPDKDSAEQERCLYQRYMRLLNKKRQKSETYWSGN